MKLSFHNAESIFKNRKIKCVKYNYSIDGSILNYDALLKLSDNENHLHILKRNILEKKEYVLEADPSVVQKIRSTMAKSPLDMKYKVQ